MSTLTAALITAVLILPALFLAFALCRIAAGSAAVDESRSRVWDEAEGRWVRLPYGAKPGPGQLTESEVDAFDRLQVELDDLVTGPQWAAGRARLLNAIRAVRDDQKGDTP
jgi:hypothetical protein